MEKGCLGVIALRRVEMLRREPIIDRYHLKPRCIAKTRAGIVVTFEPAQDEAAAVIVDDGNTRGRGRARLAIAPAADGALWPRDLDREILRRHSGGARSPHLLRVAVVPGAVLLHAEVDCIGRVEGIGALDIGEHFRIGRHRVGHGVHLGSDDIAEALPAAEARAASTRSSQLTSMSGTEDRSSSV